jgi:hypothetical protein
MVMDSDARELMGAGGSEETAYGGEKEKFLGRKSKMSERIRRNMKQFRLTLMVLGERISRQK